MNACTTHDQSSTSTNPEQESAPSEKLTSSNPHLHHVADDIKHVEGKNTFRSQQQEFVATDDGG